MHLNHPKPYPTSTVFENCLPQDQWSPVPLRLGTADLCATARFSDLWIRPWLPSQDRFFSLARPYGDPVRWKILGSYIMGSQRVGHDDMEHMGTRFAYSLWEFYWLSSASKGIPWPFSCLGLSIANLTSVPGFLGTPQGGPSLWPAGHLTLVKIHLTWLCESRGEHRRTIWNITNTMNVNFI